MQPTLYPILRLTMTTLLLIIISISIGCKQNTPEPILYKETESQDTIVEKLSERIIDYDTTQWTEILPESGVLLDIRYATENNFTKKQIYDCGRCFLRPVVAKKILQLQKDINKRYGMSLKLFDCYRPRPAQQKLWDIVPDARFVTPPNKGSMHNRGLAVDITLVDKNNEELDMGTPYDFFGRKAYTTNTNLPNQVLKNRNVLRKLMEIHGLKGIRTEWWHFSLKTVRANFDDWVWGCDDSL